jgi:predicted dehydrogenase
VICDKPVTRTVDEARELHRLAKVHGRLLAVSYNYSGYPMVRAARAMVRAGEIGRLRRAHGQFPAGYLTTLVERQGQKQAVWRTDPERVGASASLMDLGTHVHHLLRFVTGLEFTEILADLSSSSPERRVDDNAEVLFRLSNGASGSLWVSMTAAGIDDEGPSFTICGTEGSLQWSQRNCNELRVRRPAQAEQILVKAASYLGDGLQAGSRIGFGPPDGFLEAFANLYRDFADAIAAGHLAQTPDTLPTIDDGLAGLQFVEAGAASSATRRWNRI